MFSPLALLVGIQFIALAVMVWEIYRIYRGMEAFSRVLVKLVNNMDFVRDTCPEVRKRIEDEEKN